MYKKPLSGGCILETVAGARRGGSGTILVSDNEHNNGALLNYRRRCIY